MVNLTPLLCVIEDIMHWRQDWSESLSTDAINVCALVESRGIEVVMISFPEACKVIDASLSSGYLDICKFPAEMRKTRNGVEVPAFFECIFEELYRPSGGLVAEPDVTAIFFLRQLMLLYKKVDMPCPQETVNKAVAEFVEIEGQMRKPTFDWHLDQPDMGVLTNLSFGDGNFELPLFGEKRIPRRLLEVMDKVARYVCSTYPVLDPMEVIPRHGPGAVSDLKTGMDKYLFSDWPRKLSNVFEFETFGLANYGCISDHVKPGDTEHAARLIAVPKTLKSPRLIASEPTYHQFLQQGLMRWFRSNLRYPLTQTIDFSSQDKSRTGALKASEGGWLATVDLSSASDRLSSWVVERFFCSRPDIVSALHAVRTRVLEYKDSESQDCKLLLKKYANQGSAVTFSLQSIIYASICVAAFIFERGLPLTSKTYKRAFAEIRVFGDDLIVPTDTVYSLGILMSYLGLKINWGKTHREGRFRESCGIDAYGGYDISPMYLSSLSPGGDFSGLSSWIDCSNVAYQKGLWSLSEYMVNCIPDKYVDVIPVSPKPLGCLYLQTMQSLTYVKSRTRWCRNTQSTMILGITARVKGQKGDRVGSQDLLHTFLSIGVNPRDRKIITDQTKISRVRSFSHRTILKVRWVSALASLPFGE